MEQLDHAINVTWLLRQHNQENARMSPDPSLQGVGSGHETKRLQEYTSGASVQVEPLEVTP